ncbi:MAG: type I-C CRISPR-associated protein Cas8c/Csd1 [Thiohalocapsa sp.]|nr:type I-C CRISPR-associated protein Cas8c/Csd1 [Thiohalocapsa sp.]
MILQALHSYYERKQAEPDPRDRLPSLGFEEKEIPFILEIDADGHLICISDTRSGEGKKKTAQRFLVPQGVKKTSGIAANLLWDNAEYVLGIPDPKKQEGKAEEKVAAYHARLSEMLGAFRDRIAGLAPEALDDQGVRAVLSFIGRFKPADLEVAPEWQDVASTNPLLTFRMSGDVELICQRAAVVEACRGAANHVTDGICLVTGAAASIERLHTAIKGVWGAQSSGANVVSFNRDAFSSYGKEQGRNAPVGAGAAFAYTTALNHLLAKGSRQRVQVGDTSTVFWASVPHDLETQVADIFGEPPKDEPDRAADAVRALYESVQSGSFAVGSTDDLIHVLGLAPNAARISIRFWETATALELGRRITRHFDDLHIVRGPNDPEYPSLFRLLAACAVQGKADNIPPNLGGAVMRAILEGIVYPATLLSAAVRRCRAERRVSYLRAAIIKACLLRAGRQQETSHPHRDTEILPMLDPENPHTGYRLGRLFAALEKIQEEASPGLNATIRDRYYGAASGTPVTVFPTLLRLKNHHIAKLNTGRAVNLERLIGEILSSLSEFPANLPLAEQGRFALGYYHQRQALFTKVGSATTTQKEKLDEPEQQV